MAYGKLFLIPNTLHEGNYVSLIHLVPIIASTDIYIVEEIKSARRLLKGVLKTKDINSCTFKILDKHKDYQVHFSILDEIKQDKNIGIISEAGLPCIADPGFQVVQLAHEMGIEVVPVSGPISMMMALMASGFNGQSFTFNGYLPIEQTERKNKIIQLESFAKKNHTQLFMDTPFRNNKTLEELLKYCKPDTLLCIACNLMAKDEFIQTQTIADWKKIKPDLNKKPCIFILGK